LCRRATATRPETAFSKNLGGEFSKKYAKGILGGAQHSSAVLGGGLGSHLALETGSSFVVKLSQIRTFLELVAHSGGFFFGCAMQNPYVFLGGIGIGARQKPRLFFRPS